MRPVALPGSRCGTVAIIMTSQKENIPGPGDGSDIVKSGYLKKLKVSSNNNNLALITSRRQKFNCTKRWKSTIGGNDARKSTLVSKNKCTMAKECGLRIMCTLSHGKCLFVSSICSHQIKLHNLLLRYNVGDCLHAPWAQLYRAVKSTKFALA